MLVKDLEVGRLYRVRSDRPTHITILTGLNRVNSLDIHLGNGSFEAGSRIRPMDHLVYLGEGRLGRYVLYRGKKLVALPNIWQHVVPLEEE